MCSCRCVLDMGYPTYNIRGKRMETGGKNYFWSVPFAFFSRLYVGKPTWNTHILEIHQFIIFPRYPLYFICILYAINFYFYRSIDATFCQLLANFFFSKVEVTEWEIIKYYSTYTAERKTVVFTSVGLSVRRHFWWQFFKHCAKI